MVKEQLDSVVSKAYVIWVVSRRKIGRGATVRFTP